MGDGRRCGSWDRCRRVNNGRVEQKKVWSESGGKVKRAWSVRGGARQTGN